VAASERPTLAAETLLDDELSPTTQTREAPRSGPQRRRSHFRSRPVLALGLLLLVLLAAAVYGRQKAVDLQADVIRDLDSGQHRLEAGKVALSQANQRHDPGQIAQARADFTAAYQAFASAKTRADGSRLLSLGSRIPGVNSYVKPRLAAVDGIAEMGMNLSNAAGRIAVLDLRLINPDRSTSAGARLLATLRTSTPDIAEIRSDISRAQRALEGVDASVLPATQRGVLEKARSTITAAASGIAEFQRLTPALVEILGGNGRRVYLIEQVNAAELRSGGGFIGTESVISVDNGSFKLISSGDSYAFDGYLPDERPRAGSPAYVRPPSTLTGFFSGYSWSFEDSNFFPDFQTNAKWAEYFADRRRGLKPDAIIALDYYAVADILKVTGPITVPGYGVTFDAGNLVDQVFLRDVSDPTHKSILAAAAGPLVDHVSTLPADRWPQFLGVLNGAVVHRHLQVHFNNQVAEAEMIRVGWSGALNPAHGSDFFMETEDNFASNKSNHFITRHYTVTLTRDAAGLHHRVVVDLYNKAGAPSWYQHGYGAYVRFYTPSDATGQHLVNSTPGTSSEIPPRYPNNDPHPGYALTDGWVNIPQIGHLQLVFEYDTAWSADDAGNHVMYWQKQPGTLDDVVDLTFSANGKTFTSKTDLSQDRLLTLGPHGLIVRDGQASSAVLPGLSF
jgi:hypothetical protein